MKIHLIISSKLLQLELPMSDQERNSPYNINTKARRQVMRINQIQIRV